MALPVPLHQDRHSLVDTLKNKVHPTDTGESPKEVETKIFKRPNLVKKLFENTNLASGIFKGGMKVLLEFEFFEKLKVLLDFLSKNPLITLSLCAFLLLLGIPLFIFITFAFVSSSVTFMGFAILEGTILAMGSIVIVVILLVIFQTILMTAVAVSIISFCAQKIYNLK